MGAWKHGYSICIPLLLPGKLVYVKERGGASNADLVNQKHGKDGCKEVDGADNGG